MPSPITPPAPRRDGAVIEKKLRDAELFDRVELDFGSCRLDSLLSAALAMPLFWKHYKSDITSFIEELKAKRPSLEDEQRQGRALLWDHRSDAAAETENVASRVRQQPYVYQTGKTD